MNLLLLLVVIIIVIAIVFYLTSAKEASGEDIRLYTGEEWFEGILSGKKTIDVRPGTYEKHKDLEGKEVVYYYKDKEAKVKIERIVHFNTLNELFDKENALQIAPHLGTKEKAEESLSAYYTADKLRDLGGINAFYISVGGKTTHKPAEKKEKAKASKPEKKKEKAKKKK